MILHRFNHSLTVVITLGPRDTASLPAVVDALQEQTMPKRHWRLIVVDSSAKREAELTARFAWHPHTLILSGEESGPATVTVRAMLASRTDLVISLDGRSIPAPDYFERAVEIAAQHSFIGIFGGSVRPVFGRRRPTWQRRFLRLAGLRNVPENVSLHQTDRRTMPAPTGFVVRRDYLRRFGHIILRHPFFQEAAFARHRGDFDFRAAIARTVVQAGGSIALFRELRIERQMLSDDLEERTVRERLRRDAFSRVIERFVWTGMLPEVGEPTRWERMALRWMKLWQFGRISRLRSAHRQGVIEAVDLARLHSEHVARDTAASEAPHTPSTVEAHAEV